VLLLPPEKRGFENHSEGGDAAAERLRAAEVEGMVVVDAAAAAAAC